MLRFGRRRGVSFGAVDQSATIILAKSVREQLRRYAARSQTVIISQYLDGLLHDANHGQFTHLQYPSGVVPTPIANPIAKKTPLRSTWLLMWTRLEWVFA